MSVVCVTGTSTDVGKTIVTAALAAGIAARGRTVAVVKPAQTGIPDDADGDLAVVRRLAGAAVGTHEFARYGEPLAPDTAARRSGRPPLRLHATVERIDAIARTVDTVLVEGAGGVAVRLGVRDGDGTAAFTLADVAAALDAPTVVVAAAGLGTLNHTSLTVDALVGAGVACPGTIIGAWPDEPDLASRCNLDDLPRVTGRPVLGVVPAGVGAAGGAAFARDAPTWVRPALDTVAW